MPAFCSCPCSPSHSGVLPSHSSCKRTLPTQHTSKLRELIGHAAESAWSGSFLRNASTQRDLTKQGQGERVEVKGRPLLFRLSINGGWQCRNKDKGSRKIVWPQEYNRGIHEPGVRRRKIRKKRSLNALL